jgi:hypothetical protein
VLIRSALGRASKSAASFAARVGWRQHGAHRSHDSVCSFSFGMQTSNGRCSAGASIAKSRRAVFSFPLGPLWKAHFQLSASGGAPCVRVLLQITTDNGAAMACAVAMPIRRTG